MAQRIVRTVVVILLAPAFTEELRVLQVVEHLPVQEPSRILPRIESMLPGHFHHAQSEGLFIAGWASDTALGCSSRRCRSCPRIALEAAHRYIIFVLYCSGSSTGISGRIPGTARASSVFPTRGGPIINTLWTTNHTLFSRDFPPETNCPVYEG